jgi:hypothetical protein
MLELTLTAALPGAFFGALLGILAMAVTFWVHKRVGALVGLAIVAVGVAGLFQDSPFLRWLSIGGFIGLGALGSFVWFKILNPKVDPSRIQTTFVGDPAIRTAIATGICPRCGAARFVCDEEQPPLYFSGVEPGTGGQSHNVSARCGACGYTDGYGIVHSIG